VIAAGGVRVRVSSCTPPFAPPAFVLPYANGTRIENGLRDLG
jgi:hypothetical protein